MMITVKTNDQEIIKLLKYLIHKVQITLNTSVSIYLMGSLARGGFSEHISDIDIGLICNEITGIDQILIDKICNNVKEQNPKVTNKISIFWGSVNSINNASQVGRFPIFDIIDIVNSSVLIAGKSRLGKIIAPSIDKAILECAKFSLKRLGSIEKISEIKSGILVEHNNHIYISKAIMFPVRFIYLNQMRQISGNDESYDYYIDNYQGHDAALVKAGYAMRQQSNISKSELSNLFNKGVIPLYIKFIDIYIETLTQLNEQLLLQQMQWWRTELQKPAQASSLV